MTGTPAAPTERLCPVPTMPTQSKVGGEIGVSPPPPPAAELELELAAPPPAPAPPCPPLDAAVRVSSSELHEVRIAADKKQARWILMRTGSLLRVAAHDDQLGRELVAPPAA